MVPPNLYIHTTLFKNRRARTAFVLARLFLNSVHTYIHVLVSPLYYKLSVKASVNEFPARRCGRPASVSSHVSRLLAAHVAVQLYVRWADPPCGAAIPHLGRQSVRRWAAAQDGGAELQRCGLRRPAAVHAAPRAGWHGAVQPEPKGRDDAIFCYHMLLQVGRRRPLVRSSGAGASPHARLARAADIPRRLPARS